MLREGLLMGFSDHRRAVQSYAAGRGLDIAWTEGSATLDIESQSLNLGFDALGRVSAITGTVIPEQVRSQG